MVFRKGGQLSEIVKSFYGEHPIEVMNNKQPLAVANITFLNPLIVSKY